MKRLFTSRITLSLIAALAVVGAGVGFARAQHSSPARSSQYAAEREGPVLHDDFGPFTASARSLGELASSSALIARVRPVSQLNDYWPDATPQIWVYSRFVLRIEEVISGDGQPGQTIVVYVPGGTKARWGNPQPGGTFKPQAGSETMNVEYGGFPRFDPGREEIVFLQRTAIQDGSQVFWSPPEGRYQMRNGRLVSIFVDVPIEPTAIIDKDAKADVIGKSLEELKAIVHSQGPLPQP
jgi:hypothetical protein